MKKPKKKTDGRRKLNWSAVKDAFLEDACKRYRVTLASFGGGYCKYFWFKRNAIDYFEKNKNNAFRVSLEDLFFLPNENLCHHYLMIADQINENLRPKYF